MNQHLSTTSIYIHNKNMDETLGRAVYIIQVNSKEAVDALKEFQGKVSDVSEKGQQDTKSLSDGFNNLTSAIASLATAHLALSGTASAISDLTDSYNQYEAAMNGVKAVASATGNSVSQSLQAVKDVTAGGLISQTDAAAAIKNLQLYGYNIEQAAQMLNIMADAAVYNRQANYSVSEAVRVTTEGIRMENSVLSDASGITTNIAKMYENYAAQLGKTTNSLTQAEKAQAVYNGFLQEGSVFAGNAASYTNTLAGSQQKLETAITEVKQTMGAMFEQFTPIIRALADWVSQNKEVVATLSTTVGILTAGGGLVAALSVTVKGIQAASKAMDTLRITSANLKIGLATLAVSLAASFANNLVTGATENLVDMSAAMEMVSGKGDDTSSAIEGLGTSSDKSADKVANLRDQLAKLDRDYNRDLKKIADNHEANLAKLTQQIEEANVDYRRTIDERNANFNVSLAKQERSHQETVDELMTQLNFLQRYNNDYNKQKLTQVQFALNKEKALYQQQTEAQQAEIDLQNAADRAKLEQKTQQLQKELDDELNFMNKHRDALNSVRDVILLDEVESLRERYEEQRASYTKQISEAAQAGTQAGEAYINNYNQKIKDGFQQAQEFMVSSVGMTANLIANASKQHNDFDSSWFGKLLSGFGATKATKGYASGGYTGRGAPNEVAGVVHRGEYVVPASMVDQSTGTPKTGSTQNITVNLSGILATSQQAKRELAQELQRAIQQVEQARLA